MTSNLIYIVEDDSSIRELEKYALLNSGFTVEGFDNSKELYNALGTVLTAIIQSSSASVGILQALAVTGTISVSSAFPIILGQNIGTCITAKPSKIEPKFFFFSFFATISITIPIKASTGVNDDGFKSATKILSL